MKNILFATAGFALCLGFASCDNAKVDDDRDYKAIDSTVNARLTTLRDSMAMECNNMILSAAQAKADSILALKGKTTGTKRPSGGTTTTPAPTPTDPKDKKMGGDTQTKKEDKMEGNTQTKKEDKMNKNK